VGCLFSEDFGKKWKDMEKKGSYQQKNGPQAVMLSTEEC
jgi:hypothetical protein